MPAIMVDHDIEVQRQVLPRLLTSVDWHALWTELAVRVESFASLGMPANTSDATLWQLCQTQQIIPITGNRNEDSQHPWKRRSRHLIPLRVYQC